ncbi:uncharacterized protein DDB_G0284459-like isoform X3 [Halichondria panicea]|uniref:uncharacterized protein DDB_G0284459-like isoform X3 n=1 Tax=Halichondria panicea TaxID=6063 RepID=UPI00312B7D00
MGSTQSHCNQLLKRRRRRQCGKSYHLVPVQATDEEDVGPENIVIGSKESPLLVATHTAILMDPTLIKKRHAGESDIREITSTDIQEECRGVTNTLNNSSGLCNPQTETEDLLDDDGRKKQFQEQNILGFKVVTDLQRPSSLISDDVEITIVEKMPVKVMIVDREAPSQIVHMSISKTVKFKGDNKKTSKSDLLNEINNERTTKVRLKQQFISFKEQLDDKRESKATDAKQNESSTNSVDLPEDPENFPTESGGPPTDSECHPTELPADPPTEPIDFSADPPTEPIDFSADPPTEPIDFSADPPTEPIDFSADPPTEPNDLPANPPTEPNDLHADLPTEPIDPTDCVWNKQQDSATNDNLSESSGNADDNPAETEHLNEPTISHDPPSTQSFSAGAGCPPNEQGNSSNPSSEQDTSTTDTPSYPSTTTSKTDKSSDITSDQTEDPQTPQTSHDLPSKDSTAKTKDSARNQNHRKKRTKTKHQTPSQAPRKRCRSRNKRNAIKNRNQKKNEGKNPFPTQPPNEDVTRRPHDTDKQLVHQQKLDLGNTQAASRKNKRRRQHRRRLTATQSEEEPLPNSDDSESKRDADGHESTGSEVKFKRPNDNRRHRTRAPQSGDGGGALRDPEQSTNSSNDSVSEDKSWTRPTQESDPFTSKSDMVYHRPRPPPTSEGQPNCYVPSHKPPQPEEMASCVQVFAEPLHDPTTGQLLPATSHCSQLVFPTPSARVPVSLQSVLLYWFVIIVIRGTGSGITLRDAISGWVETREPNQLRRLIVALIRFVMMWGRGIRSLDVVTVQGEGVVNVAESGLVEVASSDWESEQLLLLASIVEEFLGLWEIQSQ